METVVPVPPPRPGTPRLRTGLDKWPWFRENRVFGVHSSARLPRPRLTPYAG